MKIFIKVCLRDNLHFKFWVYFKYAFYSRPMYITLQNYIKNLHRSLYACTMNEFQTENIIHFFPHLLINLFFYLNPFLIWFFDSNQHLKRIMNLSTILESLANSWISQVCYYADGYKKCNEKKNLTCQSIKWIITKPLYQL